MLRDAATLILYRNAADGLHVLMGLRNAHHVFMPSAMVFPGGGVDAEDFGAELAAPLPARVLARLEKAASPELARALGAAAARECREEAGLSLGAPPDLSGLDYLCRAETPERHSRRFNARFFVAEASVAQGTLGGTGELEMLDWYSLERLLGLEVPHVTGLMLEKLGEWHGMTPEERAARPSLVYRHPVWELD